MVEVSIISGSASDAKIAERAGAVLAKHNITYDSSVISAHREPERLDEFVKMSNCKIFIAIAGLSAALPGVIASRTKKPVIGVPVSGPLQGIDALLSIVQMPKGVPVACVGIDNGDNAALLAVRILSIT
ncbi:MAG: 5-(carboxyamino)imidazole ribonucleotide mutase [Methanomicrobiales archaeon]|nr:5-(carboxyamino)imidazole ribonucleotide mutase [Methanomicrobiales archaeon]